ncbi:hypothetical protein SDC9_204227 [bioreactor metagenome]|uniref:Uncharacterized protein n=1 Tax=bioreactor metagenome TaxID=1076179 RepID=A0A645IZE1_9ZZZZ
MDGTVLFQRVAGTEAVFYHHQRQAVTVVNFVQCIAQALRVDLPAPFAGLQIWVLKAARKVAAGLRRALVGGDAVGHVVAQRVKIDRARL